MSAIQGTLSKVLLSLAGAGTGLFIYSGGFQKPEFNEKVIDKKLFVYKKNNGDYSIMKFITKQVTMDLKEIDPKNYTFAKLSGQSSSDLERNYEGRPIFGGLFDISHKSNIDKFLMRHPSYNVVELEDLNALSAKFPHRTGLSSKIMRWKRIYSSLLQHGINSNKINESGPYYMELYPYLSGGEKAVEVVMPYGDNAELLSFAHLNLMK